MSKSQDLLDELFQKADQIGKHRYHRLTADTFEAYRRYDYWRYIGGDGECGSTPESQQWVQDNSENHCPICDRRYRYDNGRSIDHKLPRSQYPWLSLDFKNLWVICRRCNVEKGERHWYEYEHYILTKKEKYYNNVRFYRPTALLNQLQED